MPYSFQSLFTSTSACPQPAVSVATSRMPLPAISIALLRVLSLAISVVVSRVPSAAPSCAALIAPLPVPSLYPPSSCALSPMGLDEGGSGLDGDDDISDSSYEVGSRGKEDDMDNFMDISSAEPKAKKDIHSWEELQKQLKSDWVEGQKKNEMPTYLNKLTILHNFATLYIKGVKCITTSEEITQSWHKGMGGHFAHQIQVLAQHY